MFRVYAKPNGAAAARFGIVVSKRVIPQAVARNYCKRLAREVFRAEREALAGGAEIGELWGSAQRQCHSRSAATQARQDPT